MNPALAMALLLPLVSAAAAAEQHHAIEECEALSQAGMRICLTRKAAESQALLKRAEGESSAVLSRWDENARYAKLAKERLDASSNAFERYREAQCAFMASLGGGAITGALDVRRLACISRLDEERATSLANSVAALPRR